MEPEVKDKETETSKMMRSVMVTPEMAMRILAFLQRNGIKEFNDAITIDDLMRAAGEKGD